MIVVENEIDDMIPIIFLNKTNLPIKMSIAGIEDVYDMFCFCLDILVKGIILLYGNNEPKLNLETLTQSNLQHVIEQMKKASIKVQIDIIPMSFKIMNAVSIPPKNDSVKILSDYVLEIILNNSLYKIRFECIRYLNI